MNYMATKAYIEAYIEAYTEAYIEAYIENSFFKWELYRVYSPINFII